MVLLLWCYSRRSIGSTQSSSNEDLISKGDVQKVETNDNKIEVLQPKTKTDSTEPLNREDQGDIPVENSNDSNNKENNATSKVKLYSANNLKSPSAHELRFTGYNTLERKDYSNVNSIDRKNPTSFQYSTKIKLPSFKLVEEKTDRPTNNQQVRVTNINPDNKPFVKRRYVRTFSSGVTIPLQGTRTPIQPNEIPTKPNGKPEDLVEALAELDNIANEPNNHRFRPAAAKRQIQKARRKKSATICIEQRLT